MQGESEKDMTNRYWFTNEDGENVLNDFCGTEKQAVEYAEEQAEILGENIYVNCGEDIVDVAYAQNKTGSRITPAACFIKYIIVHYFLQLLLTAACTCE